MGGWKVIPFLPLSVAWIWTKLKYILTIVCVLCFVSVFIWDILFDLFKVLPASSTQFGGKLVSFENPRDVANSSRSVYISQVVTEHSLLQRSGNLEESLSRQQYGEFCEQKVQEASNAHDKNIWNFLKVQSTNTQCSITN